MTEVLPQEALARLEKRLETSFQEIKISLEEVKKLRSNLKVKPKEVSSSTSTLHPSTAIKSSTSRNVVRWISRIILLLLTSIAFLPGLIPVYLILKERPFDPKWMIGVDDQVGEVVWRCLAVLSTFGIGGLALILLVTLIMLAFDG